MSGMPPPDLLEEIAARLKALADPMRLRILHVLEGRELFVGEICEQVDCSQANVSKQLGVLRRAGLVRPRRAGMKVYYRVDDDAVFGICRLACGAVGRKPELEKSAAAYSGR
jgi:DNA-binding transcriptional ArsR family regulator